MGGLSAEEAMAVGQANNYDAPPPVAMDFDMTSSGSKGGPTSQPPSQPPSQPREYEDEDPCLTLTLTLTLTLKPPWGAKPRSPGGCAGSGEETTRRRAG